MNNYIFQIKLSQEIAPTIGSRDIVLSLRERILSSGNLNRVELDFEHVKFISRSAAHEFLLLEDVLRQDRDTEVLYTHQNEDVHKMFQIVRDSRHTAKPQQKPFQFERMDANSFFAMNG